LSLPPRPIQEVPGGARLRVKVLPRASHTEVAGIQGDLIRIRLAAAPVDGAANQELLRYLAERLVVPKSAVQLVSGHTGRTKVLMVSNVTGEQVRSRLAL
jgi:uncharacterized protein (TIGR00251 family)